MSFHYQRFTNRICSTSKPTSAYSYHYSFLQKRGLKPETWVPTADSTEIPSAPLVSTRPIQTSNWRVVKDRKVYESEGAGMSWRRPLLMIVIAIVYMGKRYNYREEAVIRALRNEGIGLPDLQQLYE